MRSANFNVIGEASEAELRTVAQRLEQFREVFAELFPQIRSNSKTKANVLIFRDAESFRPFKPLRPDGTADDAIAGYFLAAENVNYITLAMKGGKSDPFHTIFHEYLHFLLKSHTGKTDLPPWLAEGLAQYFETLEVTPDGKVIIGAAPQNRIGALRGGQLLSDSDLFSSVRTSVHAGSGAQRTMFYSQSWLLVHYLLHRWEGRPQERLERFLKVLGQSDSPSQAVKQIYGIEPGQLGDALRAYAQLPVLPVSIEPVTVRLTAGGGDHAVRIPTALVQAYLGDLLHNMDRLVEAEKYLRAAVAGDNKLVLANSSLGMLLIRQEKWDEAARHLETAVSSGSADYFAHFNYAYALSRLGSPGGMVRRFAPAVFTRMSESLKRSIALEPDFAQSYRVLGFISLVNGENLTDAVALLQKGLSLKPGDEGFEVLLAKVLVRLERFGEAREYAEKLSQRSTDPEVREDATEILSSITQFSKTKLRIEVAPTSRNLPWSPSLVLLKRSWVTPTEVEALERERDNTNLNRVLERARPDETRILGTIQKVDCVGGNIIYNVRSGGENLKLFGERFDDLRMAVLVAGQHSFKIDCGVRFPSNPVVLSFTTLAAGAPVGRPQLRSITFVPENFKLKTPEELASSRFVVVENDRPQSGGESVSGSEAASPDTERRWAAIRTELRTLRAGERRAAGTLETIECTENGFTASAFIDGKPTRLIAGTDLVPRWFGVEASQISLGCGSAPRVTNVLFTYRTPEDDGPGPYKLIGMEFLPSGFPIASIIERSR